MAASGFLVGLPSAIMDSGYSRVCALAYLKTPAGLSNTAGCRLLPSVDENKVYPWKKPCPPGQAWRDPGFNTDQGSQFTSEAFTSMLLEHGIRISMDGKGRYMDNIFVERLWRSVKYEEVYLKAYQNVPEARAGIGAYLRFYNHERPHQALGYQTPQEIFEEGQGWRCLHEQGLALPSNLETTSPVMVPTKPAEDSLNLALSLSKQWGPLHLPMVSMRATQAYS